MIRFNVLNSSLKEDINDSEVNIAELINKCRLCFCSFSEDNKIVPIDGGIKEKFFVLTNIQLSDEDVQLSKMVCHLCASDVDTFFRFRSQMINRQEKLLRANFKYQNKNEPTDYVCVKIEKIDDEDQEISNFVDCTIFEAGVSSKVETGKEFDSDEEENSDESDKNSSDEDFAPQNSRNVTTKQNSKRTRRPNYKPTEKDHIILLQKFKDLIRKNKSKQLPCPGCNKIMHRDSMREHLNVIHLNVVAQLTCDICSYTTTRKNRLMKHKKTNHGLEIDTKYPPNVAKTKQCNICGANIQDWRRHVMKVHQLNVRNYHCDLCGLGTFFKSDMQKHVQVHIRREQKKNQKYFCESCGLEFGQKKNLRLHIKSKHADTERNLLCPICSKAFNSAQNLKTHITSHGEKNMPCKFCGKLFSCMNNLRSHLYYHTEKPRFVCDVESCGKTFNFRQHWRSHMKTHAGQKDFQCDQCEKNFFTTRSLREHKISTHERLRFICDSPNCNGSFSRREYYKKHVQAQHQDLGPEGLEELMRKVRAAVPVRKFE